MKKITIAIGTDHRGYMLKEALVMVSMLGDFEIVWEDAGTYSGERTDYPEYAQKVSDLVLDKQADCGVLLCATGIGMAIAANRNPGIYAGLVWNVATAKLAKEHDHCNVLVLPSDYVTQVEAREMITAWLMATQLNGVYAQRVAMLDE